MIFLYTNMIKISLIIKLYSMVHQLFLKNMMEKNYNFDTQDKVWTLR